MIDLETVAVAVVSSLLTGGVAFRVVLAAAKTEFVAKSRLYDENDRPLYIPREEFNGMSQRRDEQVASLQRGIDQNAGQIVSHTDRLADIDAWKGKMEERHTLIWQGVAKDLKETADSNERTARRLEDLAIRFERIDATNIRRGTQ